MKLSKLFGKFFIALVVPSLMISSCALLGLEEEEEETTSTSSSLSTPSSSGSITIGSYSYSSSLVTTCINVTGTTYYMTKSLSWNTSASTATWQTNFYSNSSCTTSAGSTLTLGSDTVTNPVIEDYTEIQVNKMTHSSSAVMTGPNGSVTDSNLYGVVGKFNSTTDSSSNNSNGDLLVVGYVIPESNTAALMGESGTKCRDSSYNVVTTLNECTGYNNSDGYVYSAGTN